MWAEAALKIVQGHLAGIFIECSYSDCQPDAVLFGHLAPRHLVAELIVLADMVSEKRRTTQSGKVDGDRSKTGLKRKRKSLGGGVPSPQPVDDLITTPGKRSRSRNSAHALALRAASPLPEEETPDTPMAESNTPTPGGDSATEHIPTSASGRGAQASSSKQRDIIDFESPTRTRFAPEPSPGSRENPLKGLRVVVIHVKDNMADGPLVGETILQELLEYEEQLATQGRALGCSFEVSKKGESFWF